MRWHGSPDKIKHKRVLEQNPRGSKRDNGTMKPRDEFKRGHGKKDI